MASHPKSTKFPFQLTTYVDTKLLHAIQQYRSSANHPSEASAIRALLKLGLEMDAWQERDFYADEAV